MIVAYHYPYPDTIYAHRTIYHGYRSAFRDLGHTFLPVTPGQDVATLLHEERADLFITASHFLYRKYIDYQKLRVLRKQGLFVLTKLDFWKSPLRRLRFNEAKGLSVDAEAITLIKSGLLGDAYFHVVEQGDARMDGFSRATGCSYHTIPLAADKTLLADARPEDRFKADISFIGTYLPEKRQFFRRWVFPLATRYDLRLYGQDWTHLARVMGLAQKTGQYFHLPFLRTLQKPTLALQDEGKIYASSVVSINVHEAYQRKFGGDCNERTFKIPLFGGFEVTDDVACIRQYFTPAREIIIALDEADWFDKIDHYCRHPEKRLPIIEAGRRRVLAEHTYHHRAAQMIALTQGQTFPP